MLELNIQNFEKEVLESKGRILVDFWAGWCQPCKLMEPLFKELEKEYEGKIIFGKLNIDENQQLAADFQVMSIPCLILFKDGREVDRIIGYMSKDDLKAEINKLVK